MAVFPRFHNFLAVSPLRVAISRQACRVLATLGLLALAACTSTSQPGGASSSGAVASTPEAKEALVRERALSRWALLIKDDLDAAYGYFSPGSREAVTLAKFKANFRRGAFREAKVDNVACDGDACVARLFVTYDHAKMKGITTPIAESWIVDGGQAWYVYGGK